MSIPEKGLLRVQDTKNTEDTAAAVALPPSRLATNAATAIFFLMALLFFARSFTNYFVGDDFFFLGRIDLDAASSYFSTSWGYNNEYRPIVAYSYALDSLVSGDNPIGYHVTNTLLHTANALLVGALSLRVGLSSFAAMLASLVFLFNPVAHEAVIWISGRPVVLGVFFVLCSCFFFLKAFTADRMDIRRCTAGYAFYLLALGTYELAVITPLLVLLLCQYAGVPLPRCRKHLAVLLIVMAAYGTLWNWFFQFQITRFPVQTSVGGALASFITAMKRSFHGIGRPEVGIFYVVIVGSIGLGKQGGKILLAGLAWFAAAYIPFFIVTGYADRFGYLSSAATATLLAVGVYGLTRRYRKPRLVMTALMVAFFATGMWNRMTLWKEAGEMTRTILQDLKQ